MWNRKMFMEDFERKKEKKLVEEVQKQRDGEMVEKMMGKIGIREIRG